MDKRDRLLELADESAARGFGALARFLDCPIRRATRAREWERSDLRRLEGRDGAEVVALFSDLDGAVGGRLGMILDVETARALVQPLVPSMYSQEARDILACSALLEAGNIIFSAAAGALGDAIGVVVFPSVPRLWLQSESGFARDLSCDGVDELGAYAVFAQARGEAAEAATRELCLIWLPTRSE